MYGGRQEKFIVTCKNLILPKYKSQPIPAAALSEALMALDHSITGIVCSNPVRGMAACLRFPVSCCLAIGRSPF
jgi:hypothetical protein